MKLLAILIVSMYIGIYTYINFNAEAVLYEIQTRLLDFEDTVISLRRVATISASILGILLLIIIFFM